MSKTLFIANLRSNWPILLFIVFMLLIYVSTSVAMYDPDSVETMEKMFELLPEGMLKAFGFDNLGTDLTSYYAHYLYGFIIIVFPMIYIVLAANKLVAKHVDTGSMAYLLTTPNSRIRVAATQAVFLLASIAAMLVIDIGILIAMSASMFPGALDMGRFLVLNLALFLMLASVGGIGFFFSCVFSDVRYSLALGGGIPIAFLVLKMTSEIGEKVDWLKYLSLYTLLDVDKIMTDGTFAAGVCLILTAVSAVFFVAGIGIFNRKSLAI